MTTPEETSETREHEGTTAPSSGKVKVVALLVGAPGVALLFLILSSAIYNDAFFVVAATAFFGVPAFFPLYYAVKIWKGPTLKNLRRVPFIAAFWSSIGVLIGGSIIILPLLDTPDEAWPIVIFTFLLMILPLVAYFVVKRVMISWLEMPQLEDSGLSGARKKGLWMLFCLVLWVCFIHLVGNLRYEIRRGDVDSDEAAFGSYTDWINSDVEWGLVDSAEVLVSIALAVIFYYVGRRAMNLNRKKSPQ